MNKRAKICFYIFLVCAFCALGIVGYFIIGNNRDGVMVGPRFFTFVEVPGAETYSLSVRNSTEEETITVNCKVLKSNTEEENIYNFHNIVKDENDVKLVEETYSQKITNSDPITNLIDCVINNYKIIVYNGEEKSEYEYPERELNSIDEKTICTFIPQYFDNINKDGKYYITLIAKDNQNQEIKKEENITYNFVATYESDFLKRESFFINGDFCDYVISSKRELEQLVWHSLLYQNNNVTFYVKTNQINKRNINDLVIQSINTYPEYDGLYNANSFCNLENNVGTLINFKYYLDYDHTKTYEFLKNKNSNLYNKAFEKLHSKDSTYNADYCKDLNPTDERHFKIDDISDEKGVKVYNCEQLFMVTQYGAKPIFDFKEEELESKPCYIVYNNARQILKEINNSDNLTNYQKALNIYRYICQNVIYDYVTLEYMNLSNDQSVATFGNINCFYLEGALFDLENQYAVCDGIAKTYALLCNIEGIECIKVNGSVGDENHAWNNIKLVEDITFNDAEPNDNIFSELSLENNKLSHEKQTYKLDGWYGVDATWGMAKYVVSEPTFDLNTLKIESVERYYEFITHPFFLSLGDTKRNISYPLGIELKEADFYKINCYSLNNKNYSQYILDSIDLQNLISYAQDLINEGNKNYTVVEFKLDPMFAISSKAPIFNNISFNSEEKNSASNREIVEWFNNTSNIDTNAFSYEGFMTSNILVVKISKDLPIYL